VAVLLTCALVALTAGCTSSQDRNSAPDGADTGAQQRAGAKQESEAQPVSAASVSVNVADDARTVPVNRTVRIAAAEGTLRSVDVRIRDSDERLRGRFSDDRTSWVSTQGLEPGQRYRLVARAVDADGRVTREKSAFRTEELTLDQQTFPSIAPLEGEVVGVGMPIIVKFDVPVTDHAAIEKHLFVESAPRQPGSWHWLDDTQVHWRPKTYWQPGTEVTVHADINSVPAGNGIYGQLSRSTSFTVGEAIVSKIDVDSHEMDVYRNGRHLRTIAISAGKEGFTTRSGTKVIMEKHRRKRMDAATIGLDEDDPDYYNLAGVEYAMRVTHSGEFLHAAPWSAGSQGSANVSHGCVGMSTPDAAWLYGISHRGDVVEVTGTDRSLEPRNGWTDWNQSFPEYRRGSALS